MPLSAKLAAPLLCNTAAPHTVQTVAADLRRREHIPKMQNNIGRKSMFCVLRQLRSKDGGGALAAMPCRAVLCRHVPCRATPRGARPGAAFCTTALHLRLIEFGEFSSGSAKNTMLGSILLPSDF
jgi:hypothetical protein